MDDVEQPRLPELGELDDGLWFIAHAALALAEQEGMGVEGRQDLARRMGQSARLPVDHPHHLRTRQLHSKLPKTLAPDEHTGLTTGVYPTDVNAWLEAIDAPYRWTPERWVRQQLEAKEALSAKLKKKPKPPPPETRLKSTMTMSTALDLIAKRKRGDAVVAAEVAKGSTPADLAKRLQSALDEHHRAKQAAQQLKEQHAEDFDAIQRLVNEIHSLPTQAERRRAFDAAGLHEMSAVPRLIESDSTSAPMPRQLPGSSANYGGTGRQSALVPTEMQALPPRQGLMERNKAVVLAALRAAGHDPAALEPRPSGKAWKPKQDARQQSRLTKAAFDHAWKALSSEKAIKERR